MTRRAAVAFALTAMWLIVTVAVAAHSRHPGSRGAAPGGMSSGSPRAFQSSAVTPVPDAQPAATFTKDIAPIVFAKCVACHQPGGSAPFSLLTYDGARQHAGQMAVATRNGVMPPWKADPDVSGEFIGQPHLSEVEIALIEAWARAGAPEGDRRDLPPVPKATAGWQLGDPDLVVQLPPYTLQPEGTDVFRIFVVRLPVDRVRFVRGMEFRQGNSRVVHHANIRIDRSATSRQYDDADPLPGYDGLIAHTAGYPDGHFLGWTPGQVPPLLPKGLAWRLFPQTDLVVELHMQPTGRAEAVQPTIALYFGDDPPERTPAMLRLGRQSIDIPAGEGHYTIADSFVLPVDVDLLAVQPHAHYRARDIEGVATLPDGTTRRLIHIKEWDFRWQHVFRYQTPLRLPKGTTLAMRYTYDNSAGNPRNPVQPPRRVFWGQRSADEMGDLWFQVLPGSDRDLELLNDRFRPKVVAEDIIGYERWLQSEPESSALHDDVAVLYLEANRPADAVRHFAASTRMNPRSASSHFNLGTALTVAGRTSEALGEYRLALELNPDYAQAHNNLGSILLRSGQIPDAVDHLERALALDDSNAQAHYNLAVAFRHQGMDARAAGHFKLALRAGDSAAVLADLASLLLTTGDASLRDPAQAVRDMERAVALTGNQNPAMLNLLATAYAAAGDLPRAVSAGEAGLRLLPPTSADAATLRTKVEGYRQAIR
jgi:cytochrome c-type biogenesis protein CcmH/NrfG/mono/diheme cytochrome c family protein